MTDDIPQRLMYKGSNPETPREVPMPDSPTSEPESDFVCGCGDRARSACAGEPFYREHEGKRYCVLHYPVQDKSADFKSALQRKLENKDFNFAGVWFPDVVSFSNFNFSTLANFSSATFSAEAEFTGATFDVDVHFISTTFSAEVNFRAATFGAMADFRDATFSATAYFGSATFSAMANFRDATFSATAYFDCADFSAAAYFIDATFEAKADFGEATFRGQADFNSAQFSAWASFYLATFDAGAGFNYAIFSAPTDFSHAYFGLNADFYDVTFSAAAYFEDAAFGAEADFSNATFCTTAEFGTAKFSTWAEISDATFSAAVNFSYANFRESVRFSSCENWRLFSAASSLNLQFARIEKPDRVSFHTLNLHPHWFINIDARKFDFINVEWSNLGYAKKELELVRSRGIASPHRLLTIASRKLAANAEENNRYREASHFRRMAFDAERLETWHGFDFRKLNWWYWLASGYGERPFQALIVLVAILVLFAALYTQVGFARWEPRLASEADVTVASRDEVGAPLRFSRALTYSAGVLTFQRPEPKPATTAAQTIVLLETILGPVQAALLALAIRRKFMR